VMTATAPRFWQVAVMGGVPKKNDRSILGREGSRLVSLQ